MTAACELTDRANEYAQRLLSADEHAMFETHLRECTSCRDELVVVQPIVDALVDWPDLLHPPVASWDRLASRIGCSQAIGPELPSLHEPQWTTVAPGLCCLMLAQDSEIDRMSMLVKLAPGVTYPPHRHADVEELYVLDGELWIDERKLCAGDYSRAQPGTEDRLVWSATGCTCVLLTSSRDILC